MTLLECKIPPPIVAVLIALGMWRAATLGPQLYLAPELKSMVIATLVILGVSFDVFGLLAFRAARTTINPLSPVRSSTLVTNGVYRATRNPMYVGLGFLLLAWAVHLSAVLPYSGLIAFVVYITRFQIHPEERVLLRLFGEQYSDYASRVRRWL